MFENLLNLFDLGGSDASAPFGFLPPTQGNDSYYWNRFNTTLSPENEDQYQRWLAEQSLKQGKDLVNNQANYDMRGAWVNDPNNMQAAQFNKPNNPNYIPAGMPQMPQQGPQLMANQQGQNIMQQIMENQRRQRMMQLAQQLMQTGQNQRRRF